jgi:hypothetical protein
VGSALVALLELFAHFVVILPVAVTVTVVA